MRLLVTLLLFVTPTLLNAQNTIKYNELCNCPILEPSPDNCLVIPCGTVAGKLQFKNKHAECVCIKVYLDNQMVQAATSSQEGKFILRHLKPGNYTLVFTKRKKSWTINNLIIEANGIIKLNYDLKELDKETDYSKAT
ncbi:MAG: carboxypeptidase-like regulatory domain-containing protein [Flavobacteriales bacterium]|nr:carboxypeptidase-like regulatory domain-containing protein [Flavobacteriales bacterium]